MKINENTRDWARSLGLALAFLGMQMNTAIKNVIVGFDDIEILMILSVVLLADWNGIRILKMKKGAFALLVLQIILLVIALLSKKKTNQLVVFHCYLIALIFVLSTQRQSINFEHFGKVLFYLSGFISVVICYQATEGFAKLIMAFHGTGKLWLEEGGDPITMSRALVINVISVLVYKKQNTIEKVLAILFAISDVIGLFSFDNRASFVCAVILVVIWFFKIYGYKLTSRKLMLISVSALIVFVFTSRSQYVLTQVNTMIESLTNGIATLLNIGGNYSLDASVATRNAILEEMNETMFSGNVFSQVILGLGYNYMYIDRPIYQAFFDFGIVGLVVYFCAVMLVPIKRWVVFLKEKDYKAYSNTYIIIVFLSLQTILDQFYCGLPYYYYLWLPAICLACVRSDTRCLETLVSCRKQTEMI